MKLVLSLLVVVLTFVEAAADEPLPGQVGVVKPGKTARFVARPELGSFALPLPGSADDPTLHGATLEFRDAGLVGGAVTYVLDASGWEALGKPAGSQGYRYRGKKDAVDPEPKGTCRIVVLRKHIIRAVCRDDVPLTTPFGAELAVVLGVGAESALRYCADFAGTEKKNDAELLRRTKAPAPASCPPRECPSAVLGSPEIGPISLAGGCWTFTSGTGCDEACDAMGLRYSEATRTYAGSDGTAARCAEVMLAVGLAIEDALPGLGWTTAPAVTDTDCDGVGLGGIGCAGLLDVGETVRCTTPPTNAESGASFGILRPCACR